MRTARPVILVVVASLITVGWWVTQRAEEKRRDTLTGIVETRQISLGSKVAGRVAEVFVHEGDNVRAAQPLIRFEAGELKANVAGGEAAVAAALAKLKLLRAGTRVEEIARAQAAYDQAAVQAKKLERGNRPEEIRQAQAAYREALAGLAKLKAGSRPEEIAGAKGAYDAAVAEYKKLAAGPRPEELSRAQAVLRAATADREQAENDAQRLADLFYQNAIPKQQLEQAQTRVKIAREAEATATQTLEELQNGTRVEDLEAAKGRMDQAEQAYNLAKAGARPEDIAAAQQRVAAAQQALIIVRKGPRVEDVQAAKDQAAQAEAALDEALHGARKEDIDAARAVLRQAQAEAKQALTTGQESVVRAPSAGTVQKLDLRPGDLVQPGREVAVLQPADDLWIKVYVPEDKLRLVKVGKKVDAYFDGFPFEAFSGTVEFISTRAEFTPRNLQTTEERVNSVFAVRIRLDNRRGLLCAGMVGEIRLSELTGQ